MPNANRVMYLEKKVKAIKSVTIPNPTYDHRQTSSPTNPIYLAVDVETKYRKRFEKSARYLGHGVYEWQGVQSRDTAVLFLKGVLHFEHISFKEDIED
jgi:hypothetical protein